MFEVQGNYVMRPAARPSQCPCEGMYVKALKFKAVWSIELAQYEMVVPFVTNLMPMPQAIRDALRASLPSCSADELRRLVGEDFYNTLYEYQRIGAAHIVGLGGSGMIADEMGLGKTFQALAVMRAFPTARPCVITCPASVRDTWRKAVATHVTTDVQCIYSRKNKCNAEVVIISFELLSAVKPRGVMRIYDESHRFGDFESIQSRAAVALGNVKDSNGYVTKHTLLLTGTPMNRPVQLYVQLLLLMNSGLRRNMFKGVFPFRAARFTVKEHMDYFAVRYASPKRNPHARGRGPAAWDLKGHSRLHELNAVMNNCFMVRRLKKDVQKDLPPLRRTLVQLDMPEAEEPIEVPASFEEARQKFKSKDAKFMEAIRQTAAAKIAPSQAYLRTVVQFLKTKPNKTLVFAHHRVLMKALREILREEGMPHIMVDGSVRGEVRGRELARFNDDPAIRVGLMSITATATGLNLVAADLALVFELSWGPDIQMQMEARIWRIGQKFPVEIRCILAPDSTDDVMWRIINNKADVAGQVMDNTRVKLKFEGEDDKNKPAKRQKKV